MNTINNNKTLLSLPDACCLDDSDTMELICDMITILLTTRTPLSEYNDVDYYIAEA